MIYGISIFMTLFLVGETLVISLKMEYYNQGQKAEALNALT